MSHNVTLYLMVDFYIRTGCSRILVHLSIWEDNMSSLHFGCVHENKIQHKIIFSLNVFWKWSTHYDMLQCSINLHTIQSNTQVTYCAIVHNILHTTALCIYPWHILKYVHLIFNICDNNIGYELWQRMSIRIFELLGHVEILRLAGRLYHRGHPPIIIIYKVSTSIL